MKAIHHVIEIAAPPGRIFAALTTTEGLSGWWTTKASAQAEAGAVVDFTFDGDFNPDMRVTEFNPPAAAPGTVGTAGNGQVGERDRLIRSETAAVVCQSARTRW
jgi:uncharacterized protein YndB with AHSA1/START domain